MYFCNYSNIPVLNIGPETGSSPLNVCDFLQPRAGQSGYRIPVGAKFSALVQFSSGTHSSSYKMVTACLSREQSGRGVALNIHLHLAPRLKKE
jgi:hypothetical protein